MELRRALLLFAIVLGLAAVATSVSRPTSERREESTPGAPRSDSSPPQAEARPAAPRLPEIGFSSADLDKPATEHLPVGRAVTVTVEVQEPGQVELRGLGLTGVADPLTPARFDVLAPRPARHPVRFRPAAAEESRTLGVLVVDAPGTRRRQPEGAERGLSR